MSDTIPTRDSHPDLVDLADEIELSAPELTDLLPPASEDSGSPRIVDSPVRGESILAVLEKLFLLFDRLLARGLPKELNPFLQTGAIAMVSLLIATGTGVFLLLWYSPSVVQAFASVASMEAAPWTGGLVRSLHRYSSDMCLFFSLVHAIRLLFERRFTGPRWLAWTSGVAMLGIIWFIGWTGYWLVWDVRAQHIAVDSAKLLDVLPIFADPMGRTFLVNETVNSLLFFVVFFMHMMIPLIFGVATWFHLARISRPKFITGKFMSYWVVAILLALSIFYPATSAEPADMTAVGQSFTMDGWYLFPIALADRLGSGALWGILLVGSLLAFSIPKLLGKGYPDSATVIVSRCNACGNCHADCPYNAITMVPRTDDRKEWVPLQAQVDPNRCIACGICAGSCDTAGSGLLWFRADEKRRISRDWLREMQDTGEKPFIAYVCENSAGKDLVVDPQTGICAEFPGYRVLKVPCAGWVHPLMVERRVWRGAEGVLVVTCGPGECRYREGARWIRQRMDGERAPSLHHGHLDHERVLVPTRDKQGEKQLITAPPERDEHLDRDKILVLALDKTRGKKLIDQAAAFQRGEHVEGEVRPAKAAVGFTATVLGLFIACLIALGSDVPYAAPVQENSALVVSFRHPGQVSNVVKTLTEAELEKIPVHMRQAEVHERRRMPVRLRVRIDGQVVREESYSPKGIWGDGPSVAIETFPVAVGKHRVEVALGDGADEHEWQFIDEKAIDFTKKTRRVLIFDRVTGFSWY